VPSSSIGHLRHNLLDEGVVLLAVLLQFCSVLHGFAGADARGPLFPALVRPIAPPRS
jgi:hypothetical protein